MTVSENLFALLAKKLREFRIPLLAGIMTGLAAHLFMFANKIPNWDEIGCLFSKGATVASGRWGLVLMSRILPNFSMPWLWGLLSLLTVIAAACCVIDLFRIERPVLQALLAALMVTAPALTATFAYMFTASSYAVAILCAVGAAALAHRGGIRNTAAGIALLVFSLSIYQVYLALTAGLLLLLVMQQQLEHRETPKASLLRGIRYVLFLLVGCSIYLAITAVTLQITGLTVGGAGDLSVLELVKRAVLSYVYFGGYMLFGLYGVASTLPSRIAHTVCAVLMVILLLRNCLREKNKGRTGIILLCLALFPLASNCILLMGGMQRTHTLMTYGFVSVYVLGCMVYEDLMEARPWRGRDLTALLMCVIIAGNIFVANRSYLLQHMAYENAYATYTSIVTQVQQTPGFDKDTKLAIIGTAEVNPNLDPFWPERSKLADLPNHLVGFDPDMVNIYSREQFMQYYIGLDVEFVTDEEEAALREDPRVQAMSIYPYEGYIQKIDDVIVVRMGE